MDELFALEHDKRSLIREADALISSIRAGARRHTQKKRRKCTMKPDGNSCGSREDLRRINLRSSLNGAKFDQLVRYVCADCREALRGRFRFAP